MRNVERSTGIVVGGVNNGVSLAPQPVPTKGYDPPLSPCYDSECLFDQLAMIPSGASVLRECLYAG